MKCSPVELPTLYLPLCASDPVLLCWCCFVLCQEFGFFNPCYRWEMFSERCFARMLCSCYKAWCLPCHVTTCSISGRWGTLAIFRTRGRFLHSEKKTPSFLFECAVSLIEVCVTLLQQIPALTFEDGPQKSPFWMGSMSFSLGRSWCTVIIIAVFGGRGWADTLHVSTFIPAEGSRGSQGHVQPFLQLKGKWRAPLYELEQSEWNHQLNLRMNWGSQRVPPQLLFSSTVYYSKGAFCKNCLAFWKRRLFYLIDVGRSSHYRPSCLQYYILGFILLQFPCAVWEAGPTAEEHKAEGCWCNRSLLPMSWAMLDFSLHLNAIHSYWILLWRNCLEDSLACPGAENHCAAPKVLTKVNAIQKTEWPNPIHYLESWPRWSISWNSHSGDFYSQLQVPIPPSPL